MVKSAALPDFRRYRRPGSGLDGKAVDIKAQGKWVKIAIRGEQQRSGVA
jgi:hypothetical protein